MIRFRIPRLGLFAALLALAIQLAVGATVPDPALAELGLGAICPTGNPASHQRAPPAHHLPDCAACPFCAALTLPAPTLGAPPWIPAPREAAIAVAPNRPPATGPPIAFVAAAQPRGPPALA